MGQPNFLISSFSLTIHLMILIVNFLYLLAKKTIKKIGHGVTRIFGMINK